MQKTAVKRTRLGNRVYEGVFATVKAALEQHCRNHGIKVTVEELEDAVMGGILGAMEHYCRGGIFVGVDESEKEKFKKEAIRLAIASLDHERWRQKKELIFSNIIVSELDDDESDEADAVEAIELLLQHQKLQQQFYYDDKNATVIYEFLRSILSNDKAVGDKRKQNLLRVLEAVYLFAISKNPVDLRDLVAYVEQHCSVEQSRARKLLAMLQHYMQQYRYAAEVVYLIAPLLTNSDA